LDLRDLFLTLNRAVDGFVSILDKKRGLLGEERVRRALVIGLLFVMAVLLSGWPYVLVYKPSMLYSSSSSLGATFISPDQLGEGPIEAVVVGLLYVLGLVGLYWSYSLWNRGRSSSPETIVALILVLISVISLYWIGTSKLY